MDGRLIAAAGAVPDDAPVASVHRDPLRPAGAVGRVVGRGDGPIVEAVVAQPGNALAALAGTTHEHDLARRQPPPTASLEAEMALSRRIQRSLIPLVAARRSAGFEVATYYEAAREVGGDFFDVFPLRDRAGRAGIVIADVTGKGIAAALLMAFARPLIRVRDRPGARPPRSRSSGRTRSSSRNGGPRCSSRRSRRSSTCGPTSSASATPATSRP